MDDGMDDDDDYEFGAGEFDLVAAMAEMEQEAALAAHVSPRERPEQGEGRGRVREQAASSTEAMLRLQVASTEAMLQVASTEATSQVAQSQVMQQATRQTTPSRPLVCSERPSRLQQTVTTGQLPRPCKSDMPSPHPQPTSPRPQLRATIPGPAGILPE